MKTYARMVSVYTMAVLFITAIPGHAGETGSLVVQAINSADRTPLPGVTIHIQNSPYITVSDTDGKGGWSTLHAGTYDVSCSLTGFGTFTITGVIIRPDSQTQIECMLTLQAEETITVHSIPFIDPNNPATYHYIDRSTSQSAISPDIFSQAKLVPGVVQNGEVLDFVFIRGTPTRATALAVEGLDSRNAVHLSTGAPVFAKGALEGIEIITGSLAPEYGNVLGGVLNSVVASGEGERSFYGDLSITSSRPVFFDSPSRQRDQDLIQMELGWNLSPRFGFKLAFANYDGNAMPWTYQVNENLIDFYDAWIIGRWQPSDRHLIKAVYQRTRGHFRFHSGPTQEGVGLPPNFWQTRPHENDLALFSWTGQVSDNTVLGWQASYLHTWDGLGPTWDGDKDFLTAQQVIDFAIADGSKGQLFQYWPEISFYESRRIETRLSLTYGGWFGHSWKATLDAQYLSIPEGYDIKAQPAWMAAALGCPNSPYCPIPPLFTPQDLTLRVNFSGNDFQLGVSLQDTWEISPSFRVLYGARLDYWPYMESSWALSPRLTFTYMPSSGTVIKLGGGRFTQPVPPAAAFIREENTFTLLSSFFPQLVGPESLWTRQYITNPAECAVNIASCSFAKTEMTAEKSWAIDFEWDQVLKGDLGLRISSYYKDLRDMLFNGRGFHHPAGTTSAATWPPALVNGGKGRSYGVEIALVKAAGAFKGWISYSYAVAEGTFPSADYRGGGVLTGDYRPLNFDVRHQVQANFTYHTDWLAGWDFNTNFQWNTGYPATERYWHFFSCELDGAGLPPPGVQVIGPEGCLYVPAMDPSSGFQKSGLFNGVRMPNYLKWDFRIEKTLVRFSNNSSVSLIGIVENLLNRKNYGTWATDNNSFREIDGDTGQVISEGARLADRRFQLGARIRW